MSVEILVGDCRDHMRDMAESSFDAIVTDPPYGLSFMGKGWDHGVPGVEFWELALRALKPGGYLLAFGGTRTFHRLAVAIEDAGFEIRDTLMWLYGSGFPKSLDVNKAIDKAARVEREVIGVSANWRESKRNRERFGSMEVRGENAGQITAPATDAARQWDGWGTALKPAWEPIIMARKPLVGTVAANVLAHGTGAINVDACRIGETGARNNGRGVHTDRPIYGEFGATDRVDYDKGRWPANVLLDETAAALLDAQSGPTSTTGNRRVKNRSQQEIGMTPFTRGKNAPEYTDSGGPSRFFYVAKASRAERNAGLEGMPERVPHPDEPSGRAWDIPGSHSTPRANHHPTVKPVALMRWLVRLVTPPGGHILDPFAGSGTTGVAAIQEGFSCTLIEMSEEYVPIIEGRTRRAENPEKPHRTPTTPTNGQMELFSHEL